MYVFSFVASEGSAIGGIKVDLDLSVSLLGDTGGYTLWCIRILVIRLIILVGSHLGALTFHTPRCAGDADLAADGT